MIWVVRAGKKATYANRILYECRIFLPWEGYKISLSEYKNLQEYRELVREEKGVDNATSISNWSGQINSFVNEMQINDYVLVPMYKSRSYALAIIKGDYAFNSNDKDKLYHSRIVEFVCTDIPADIFSQPIRYSLGAFRTIFKIRQEEEILETIASWQRGRKS